MLSCLIKKESQHLQRFALDFEFIRLNALKNEDDEGIKVLISLQEEVFAEARTGIPEDHFHQAINLIILFDVPSV